MSGVDWYLSREAYGEDVLQKVRAQWGWWQVRYGAQVPVLALNDPAELETLGCVDDPDFKDAVLRDVAVLGSVDGYNEPAAAALLAWLLRPGATRIIRDLKRRGVTPAEANRLVAAALWIEVRTVPLGPLRIAVNVLSRTRRSILRDLRCDGFDCELPVPDFAEERTPLWGVAADSDAAGERLAALGAGAVERGQVSARDWRTLELLLCAASHVDTATSTRSLAGLGNDAAVEAVADRLSVNRRTVLRRASKAVSGLRDATLVGAGR